MTKDSAIVAIVYKDPREILAEAKARTPPAELPWWIVKPWSIRFDWGTRFDEDDDGNGDWNAYRIWATFWSCVAWITPWTSIPIGGKGVLLALHVVVNAFGGAAVADQTSGAEVPAFFRTFFLPIYFPFLVAYSLIRNLSASAGKRAYLRRYGEEPKFFESSSSTLTSETALTMEVAVQRYYSAQLAAAKVQLLGEGSVMLQIAKELEDERRTAEEKRARVEIRRKGADDLRRPALDEAYDLCVHRMIALEKAILAHNEVLAKGRAFLAEFEQDVIGQLTGMAGDRELFDEIQHDMVKDDELIARSESAQEAMVGQLGERLAQMQTAVMLLRAEATASLGSNNESIATFIERADQTAQRMVDILPMRLPQ